jgi:hypothetical protein
MLKWRYWQHSKKGLVWTSSGVHKGGHDLAVIGLKAGWLADEPRAAIEEGSGRVLYAVNASGRETPDAAELFNPVAQAHGFVAPDAILTESGTLAVSDVVREGARQLAKDDYEWCEAESFSGDSVRDYGLPSWLGDTSLLFPVVALAALGMEVREDRHIHLYATSGVDDHVDNMDGLSVAVVLHSDGFQFLSGDQCVDLKTGKWFMFDDRLRHEVKDGEGATTLLVLTAGLDPISAS